MSDGLIVEFFTPLTSTIGSRQIATYRDEESRELVAKAMFLPERREVRLTKFPKDGSPFGEKIGDFQIGVAKAILKSYLMSRGYYRMRRA